MTQGTSRPYVLDDDEEPVGGEFALTSPPASKIGLDNVVARHSVRVQLRQAMVTRRIVPALTRQGVLSSSPGA